MRSIVYAAALALTGMLPGFAAAPAYAETAIFAGGCFWCVESDFDHVAGVSETISGYSGGTTENPTYRNHSAGGHREVVKITFDPSVVSYRKLVDILLRSVDVTDDGGQFCDRGFSYTTAIYALDDAQADAARAAIDAAQMSLGRDIVTPVEQAGAFWPAEEYHQGYYMSQERTLSRFGYVTRAAAYKGYREGCGRDAQVRAVWGDQAFEGIAHEGS